MVAGGASERNDAQLCAESYFIYFPFFFFILGLDFYLLKSSAH